MDLITFDLDETLIHARKVHWHSFNYVFVNHGLKKISYKKFEPLLYGPPSSVVFKLIYPKLSDKEIARFVVERHKILGKKFANMAVKIPGVVRTLKKLKKKFRIGIVTNCTHKEMLALLKGAKLDKKLFDVLVGADDVKHSKPFPDEIFKAEKLTHLDAKYHVGDSTFDIIAAKKAGAKAIGVLTGINSRAKLAKKKPFKILKDVNKLQRLLL